MEKKSTKKEIRPMIVTLCSIFISATLLILTSFTSVRVLFSKKVIAYEYNKSDMPPDSYGLSTEDRIRISYKFVDYLLTDKDISYLKNLEFEDHTPMFNQRELKHMVDVKKVFNFFFKFSYIVLALFMISLYIILKKGNLGILLKSLFYGGVTSISIIIIFSLLALGGFQTFFAFFHKALGFEGDSWLFSNSDMLIRLFPLKFWLDLFVYCFSLVIIKSLVICAATWRVIRIK